MISGSGLISILITLVVRWPGLLPAVVADRLHRAAGAVQQGRPRHHRGGRRHLPDQPAARPVRPSAGRLGWALASISQRERAGGQVDHQQQRVLIHQRGGFGRSVQTAHRNRNSVMSAGHGSKSSITLSSSHTRSGSRATGTARPASRTAPSTSSIHRSNAPRLPGSDLEPSPGRPRVALAV